MALTPIPSPSGSLGDVGGYPLHIENVGEFEATLWETLDTPVTFAAAQGAPGSLGDLPVTWLRADWWTTGKQTPIKTAMITLRTKAQALSTRSRHTIVDGCAHTDLPVIRADAVAKAVQGLIDGRK